MTTEPVLRTNIADGDSGVASDANVIHAFHNQWIALDGSRVYLPVDFVAPTDLAGYSLVGHNHDGVYEPIAVPDVVAAVGASTVFHADIADEFIATLTVDKATIAFDNWAAAHDAAQIVQIRPLFLYGGNVYPNVAWDPAISWPGGIAPTLDTFTAITFITLDAGAHVAGFYGGVVAGGSTHNIETITVPIPPTAYAAFDEATALSGTGEHVTWRWPDNFLITEMRIEARTNTTGCTVDVKSGGVSLFSTKLTLDNTELTSTTAAVPAVISTTVVAKDAIGSAEVNVVGSNIKGLRLLVSGYRTAAPVSVPVPLFVQSKSASRSSGSGDLVATLTTTATAGNLLVTVATRNGSSGPTLGTGMTGWTALTQSPTITTEATAGILTLTSWYKIAAGTETNVAVTSTNGVIDVAVLEFSGIQASPLDTVNNIVSDPAGSTAASSLAWTATSALAAANSVVMATAQVGNDFTSPVAPSGFTLVETATLRRMIVSYKITTATTALSGLSTTWTTASTPHGLMQAFKGNAG